MSTLVLGLGNPLLQDDGVGIHVARLVGKILGERPDVQVGEVYAGGLRLMDALDGYDRAVIVDAMVTGDHAPGVIRYTTVGDMHITRNLSCSHDTSLWAALEFGRVAGLKLPANGDIRIMGIEALVVEDFGETLTAAVEAAVPVAAKQIVDDLMGRKT